MTVPNFDDLPVGLEGSATDAATKRWSRLRANPLVVPMSKVNGVWRRQTEQPMTIEAYENLALFRSDAIWVERGDPASQTARDFGGTVVRPGSTPGTRWMESRKGHGFLLVLDDGRPAPTSSYGAILAAGFELVDFSSNDEFLSTNPAFGGVSAAILNVREKLDSQRLKCAFSMVFKGAFWDLGPFGYPSLPAGSPSVGAAAAHGNGVAVYVPDSGYPSAGVFAGIDRLGANDYENTYSAPNQLRLDAGHGRFVAGIVHALASGASVTLSSVNEPSAPADPDPDLLSVWEAELYGDFPNFLSGNNVSPEAKLIINMSMTGTPDDAHGLTVFTEWLRTFLVQHPQLIVVAAAGNGAVGSLGQNLPSLLPAGLSDANINGNDEWHRVVSVGATNHYAGGNTVLAAGFSNWGPWVKCWAEGVDIVAPYLPGDAVDGTPFRDPNPLAKWSGTSFATPIVAAVLADELSNANGVNAARDAVRRLFTARRAANVTVKRKVAAGSNVTKDEPGAFIPTPTL